MIFFICLLFSWPRNAVFCDARCSMEMAGQPFAPLSYGELFSRIRAATYDITLRDSGDSINLEPNIGWEKTP
jgi:hypothetical protein